MSHPFQFYEDNEGTIVPSVLKDNEYIYKVCGHICVSSKMAQTL
jgi:hypothetical protein